MAMTWFSDKTVKRMSGIEGRGLFARAAIDAGEIVVVKGGHVFRGAKRDALQATVGPAEIQIAGDLHIGPVTVEERDGAMMFLNHSCAPNLGVRGQIVFVAMRDINAGEELTIDYAMTDDDDGDGMACRRGHADCRGAITGKDWQSPEPQQRYAGYFSDYLACRISK